MYEGHQYQQHLHFHDKQQQEALLLQQQQVLQQQQQQQYSNQSSSNRSNSCYNTDSTSSGTATSDNMHYNDNDNNHPSTRSYNGYGNNNNNNNNGGVASGTSKSLRWQSTQSTGGSSWDDADAAAGSSTYKISKQKYLSNRRYSPPMSGQSDLFFHTGTGAGRAMAVLDKEGVGTSSPSKAAAAVNGVEYQGPVLVLGIDISHLTREMQFATCAIGVFGFSLLYGYLQELISVQICNRQLGLFLAMVQFSGYTALSYLIRTYVYNVNSKGKKSRRNQQKQGLIKRSDSISEDDSIIDATTSTSADSKNNNAKEVPWKYYIGISMLRAIDLAMTNLAMMYINYPAKTLMKSSRVVFTMIFGVFIGKKRYNIVDYLVVGCMVLGLAIFMHADANSSAVFDPLGVIMLTISLICDGAITNFSEKIMKQYNVGQDEFIFKMYSIALIAITAAAMFNGDFVKGFKWALLPGTYDEVYKNEGSTPEPSWSVMGKVLVMVLFSSMGFFGSSFSAAITKHFGALTMSITSTARKATTLFLSFFLFNNVCTSEHIAGVVIFISALTTKSVRNKSKGKKQHKHKHHHKHNNNNNKFQQKSKQQPTTNTSTPTTAELINIITRNDSSSSLLSLLFRRNNMTLDAAKTSDDGGGGDTTDMSDISDIEDKIAPGEDLEMANFNDMNRGTTTPTRRPNRLVNMIV